MRSGRLEDVLLTHHPLWREVPATAHFHIVVTRRRFCRIKADHGSCTEVLLQFCWIEIELFRRQNLGSLRISTARFKPRLIIVGRLCETFCCCFAGQMPKPDEGIGADIVEQRVQRFMEQRQPGLYALPPD